MWTAARTQRATVELKPVRSLNAGLGLGLAAGDTKMFLVFDEICGKSPLANICSGFGIRLKCFDTKAKVRLEQHFKFRDAIKMKKKRRELMEKISQLSFFH